jgi:hypothetical protein
MDDGKVPPGLRHCVVEPEWKLDERDAARRRRALQELKHKAQTRRPG